MMINLIVDTAKQTLSVMQNDKVLKTYSVSTAKNGTGQKNGSECTPLGKHIIAQKIGEQMPINSVFVGRKFTGEIYDETLAQTFPDRDWILTRILWLQGCEMGFNQGVDSDGVCCDSFRRYIYIHGTPDSQEMGVPRSHGCVRMRNTDLIEVFDWVDVNTVVQIF